MTKKSTLRRRIEWLRSENIRLRRMPWMRKRFEVQCPHCGQSCSVEPKWETGDLDRSDKLVVEL